MTAPNALYYGDNLEVLREHIADASVDLIYLDPPFKSDASYNVLFHARDGAGAPAQIRAFDDTWHWDQSAAAAFHEVTSRGGPVANALEAFRLIVGESDMLAYLAMMAPRLVELHRVLKSTGTLYLHCDPTASHYLKLLLDAVFGPERFLNEITWKRTQRHGNVSRNFGSICDTLLVYTKCEEFTWVQQYEPLGEEYATARFTNEDPDGRRWQSVTLRNPGHRPNLHFPYQASNGTTYQPHPNGWSCNLVRLQQYDREGRLHFPSKPGGQLRLKMYLDESPGVKLQNVWTDISPLNSQAAERLGYPTQKPEALLDRILSVSSRPGDVILDPFCGCGTAIASAQRHDRRWIGIDVTHLAINLIKTRLADAYPEGVDYQIFGEPTTVDGARELAENDPYQFQWWALSLVGARPEQKKKGADRGIDGRLVFRVDDRGPLQHIILSVKAGNVTSSHVRDLRGTVEREHAAIGALLSMEPPTSAMRKEAASAGFIETPWGKHPRVQLLTVAELLDGRQLEYPRTRGANVTLKSAPIAKPTEPAPLTLFSQ